ncbi:MAG: adenosine-specific kinase [Acidobacteriia bacterium]|nr:adenosine-specific kinase [Terriglobia bacterium]
MNLIAVRIDKPQDMNFVLGQSHFIKTVEDVHEAVVGTVPAAKFGLAFCEASGPCLVRVSGNDEKLQELAARNATAIGAGHSFILFLENAFPVNVLNALKSVPEVCRIFCATANPATVIVAEHDGGRAILGVVDGASPKGVESPADRAHRIDFLRKIGYKLS